MRKKIYILLFALLCSSVMYAQEDDKIIIDKSTPDFLLEKDTIFVSKKKKKKRKKKTFNKLKTKRGYTKRGAGRGLTIEQFYYLKKYKEPSKFVTPIFIYDISKLKLVKVKRYDKKKYPPKLFRVLHGPYLKKKGDIILEEGYFWIGTKHNNWFKYVGEDEIVRSRNQYKKGFPANYQIQYFDPATKNDVKEIIPIDVWGANSGTYKLYYKSGRINIAGKYIKGLKSGRWLEYYTNGKKKKESYFTWDEKKKIEVERIENEWKPNGKLKKFYIDRNRKRKEEEKKNRPKMKF